MKCFLELVLNFVEVDTKLNDSGQAHLGQPAPPCLVALLGDWVNVCDFVSERHLTPITSLSSSSFIAHVFDHPSSYIFLNKLRNSRFSYGFFHRLS